jgi:hypothetical protein
MDKARNIIRCVVFCVGLVIITVVCDFAFGQSGYVRYILHNLNNSEENIDTIVLGASHARSAIDPQKMDDIMNTNSLSLAIPGETVKDSYYVLKESCRNNDVKKVILDVDYQYWFGKQDEGYANETFIAAQMSWGSPVKWQYMAENMRITDVRYALTKRVAYANSPSKIKSNIALKLSQDYKDANIYTLEVSDANGPYVGKGFFARKVSGFLPGGEEYIYKYAPTAYKDIAEVVLENFERIVEYCNENDIELICVTSPITPYAMQVLHMDVVHDKLAALFEEYGVTYYDFNMARKDVLPRQNTDYGDSEGHMGGELAEKYSEVLAKVLSDHETGNVDRSKYFYDTFEQMYKDMGKIAEENTLDN